jgi:release factor glutamine methyltransferase
VSEPEPRTRISATKTPRHKGTRPRTYCAGLLREAAGLVPKTDAEFLLTYLLGVPRHELYIETTIPARTAARFLRLAACVRAGEPVQYLVCSAPFLDFDAYVDRRVLIPRPETEELVTRTLSRLKSKGRSPQPEARMRALDFGTGSGCIAIALARAVPEMTILAVDASKAALAVAARNVSKHGLGRRIRLALAKNTFTPALARLRGRLDLLITNPPYVPTGRLARLAKNVRREPRLALDGGPKGANIVAMLLEHGPGLLKPGGLLAMEIDSTQEAIVRALAPLAEVERDLAGRIRYVFLTR